MTLAKEFRPENPNGFEDFFKNTKLKKSVGVWTIYVTELEQQKSASFIPKKLMKLSVDRHRLKRRVLEELRPYCENNSVLVRLVKKADPDIDLSDLRLELQKMMAIKKNEVLESNTEMSM